MEPQKDAEFLYGQESDAIRVSCFEVDKEMGPGFLEAVYQKFRAKEIARQSIPFIAQQQLSSQYKEEPLLQTYVPDLTCYDKIIVEIKGTREIAPEHKPQFLNDLKATGMKLGLLVNFGH